jgi:uncharacterized protein YjbJ (UPF0337 family)
MEWNAIEGNWKQISASMKEKWNALTDDDFQFVRNKDALVARVHDRTGLERVTVERQLDALIASLPAGEKPRDVPVPFPQSGAKPQGPG